MPIEISALPVGTVPIDTDIIPSVQGGIPETNKVNFAQIKSWINGFMVASPWFPGTGTSSAYGGSGSAAGNYSLAYGENVNTNGDHSFSFGKAITSTFDGTFTVSDGLGSPVVPVANSQFAGTFSNGYLLNLTAALKGIQITNAGNMKVFHQASFMNPAETFSTNLQGSSALAANVTFSLPSADGTSAYPLLTDGSGGMYFSGNIKVSKIEMEAAAQTANSLVFDGTNLYFGSDQIVIRDGSVTPNNVALWSTNGKIKDGVALGTAATKAASDNALSTVASVSGATTANSLSAFVDTAGTVGNATGNTIVTATNPISFEDGFTCSSTATYQTGTISQTTTTVTGSGTAFTPAMLGGLFVPATGTPCIITGVPTSGTSLLVSVSQTIGAGTAYTISYGGTHSDGLGNLTGENMRMVNLISPIAPNPISVTGNLNAAWGYGAWSAAGAVTLATQSGNTVTATSGTPFASNMVGGIFSIVSSGADNGSRPSMITAFTSSTQVTVGNSATVSTPTPGFLTYSGTGGDRFGNITFASHYSSGGVTFTARSGIFTFNTRTSSTGYTLVNASTTATTFTWQTGNTYPMFGTNAVPVQSGAVTAGNMATWNATGILQDGGKPITTIITKVLTALTSSTYTPSANTKMIVVEGVGAGGGGGSVVGPTGASSIAAGSGGGAGSFFRLVINGPAASYNYICGTGGASDADGTDTLFKNAAGSVTLGSGIKGIKGTSDNGNTTVMAMLLGGAGGSLSMVGDVTIPGANGGPSFGLIGLTSAQSRVVSGAGADSVFGRGGAAIDGTFANTSNMGNGAVEYGAGGGGATLYQPLSPPSQPGGVGGDGIIYVYEYI